LEDFGSEQHSQRFPDDIRSSEIALTDGGTATRYRSANPLQAAIACDFPTRGINYVPACYRHDCLGCEQQASDLLLDSLLVKEIVLANQLCELATGSRGSGGPVRSRRSTRWLSKHPNAGITEGIKELDARVGPTTLRKDNLQVRVTLLKQGIDKGL